MNINIRRDFGVIKKKSEWERERAKVYVTKRATVLAVM